MLEIRRNWDKCTDMIFVMYWQIQLGKNQPGHFPESESKTVREIWQNNEEFLHYQRCAKLNF